MMNDTTNKPISFLMWPIVMGICGFAAGFFGPMILVPEANQGPLVGILMSGPGGVVLGLILAFVMRLFEVSESNKRKILIGASSLLVLVTLFFVLPEPQKVGELIQIQVVKCENPKDVIEAKVNQWKERIVKAHWATPREGWESELREVLTSDSGLLLTANILGRKKQISVHRKPWNKGKIFTEVFSVKAEQVFFYFAGNGTTCAQVLSEKSLNYFVDFNLSAVSNPMNDWPPKGVVNLMGETVVSEVPEIYRGL